MKITNDDQRDDLTAPAIPAPRTPRRLTLKTRLRAGTLDPAPYQGKRSSGGYVPT